MSAFKISGYHFRVLLRCREQRTDYRCAVFDQEIAYSPDIEHIDMNDHKLFSLRAEVEQGLLDDRHLSAFGRIVHHHMLTCLEEITKNVAVGLPADKAPAGHIVVVYKRLIHSYRFL